MNVLYHPCYDNIIVDAIKRLSMFSVENVEKKRKKLAKDVYHLVRLGDCLMNILGDDVIVHNVSYSSLVVKVKEKQDIDHILFQVKAAFHQ